jgi:hypothetical protein
MIISGAYNVINLIVRGSDTVSSEPGFAQWTLPL